MADVAQKKAQGLKKKVPAEQADTSKVESRQPWDVSDKSADDSASQVPEDVETPGADTENIRGKHDDPSYENIEGHAETGYPPAGDGKEEDHAESQADVSDNEEEEEQQEHGEEQQEEDEDGEDVLAAGTVNDKGEVVDDEGNVIGHIEGEFNKEIAGTVVDQEGDVLDDEGNVVAKAGLNLSKPAEEATEAIDEQDLPDEKVEEIKDELPEDLQSEAPSTIRSKLPSLFSQIPDLASRLPSEAVPSQFAGSVKNDAPKSPVDSAKDLGEDAEGNVPEAGDALGEAGSAVGDATSKAGDAVDETTSKAGDVAEDATSKAGDVAEDTTSKAGDVADEATSKAGDAVPEEAGDKVDETESKVGETVDETTSKAGDAVPEDAEDAVPDEAGDKVDEAESKVDETADEATSKAGEAVPEEADEAVDEAKETAEDAAEEGEQHIPDISILEGLVVNKAGNIVNKDGKPVGKLVEGEAKKLAGKKVDKEGKIWNDSGKVIGRAEVLPEANDEESAPFESFPGAKVDKNGIVLYEGQQVGIVIEGDIAKLVGKEVDEDGDILDKHGNAIGKAERKDAEEPAEPEPEEEVKVDYSELAGKRVNKAGNVVDDKGAVVGRICEGVLKVLIGRKVDENGDIFNDSGKKIGKAEPIPENEREDFKESGPFEDFPDAIVEKDGLVRYEGEVVGKLIEGDAKKLHGKKVDADGDVVDRNGNVLGKAERYEEEEPEPEPEVVVDNSALAGKRVNKAGNVVDSSGTIFGRLVEGDVKKLAGKMCDKQGFVRNEGGDVVGRAELVPEGEREGLKEGPFAEFDECTVNKEGKVVIPNGTVVGRLIEGDVHKLFGRAVDEDGEILDKNGNTIGKAERWEEPEEQKEVNPMSGRRVNKAGEVVDENGDVIGKLTDGELRHCVGKKIDDDGDVVDGKGTTLGHVTLLEYIPEPEEEPEPEVEQEPEEDPKAKEEREQAEADSKLAGRIAFVVEQSLDRLKPILNMITRAVDKADRTPKEELDEEALVKQVKPLIEEGGRILTETNGAIRGLDPDGRISAQAKHKTANREASPAEFHLAELLKELTGNVHETIENAKRKIEDMPHAKKELNPLWGLLAEPLGQILAAVGLLLSGVLGLVGRLLSVLGLGGLLDNLLGSLGLKGILQGLGLGSLTDSLTGKGKKGGKGLLG